MPYYEFLCDCGRLFAHYHEIKDRNNATPCPECGGAANKLISMPSVDKDTKFKDKNGQKIWFPKDGKPYFDKAARRTFHNIEQKMGYLNKHNLVMDGSDSPNKWPEGSGDMKDKSYRKSQRLED